MGKRERMMLKSKTKNVRDDKCLAAERSKNCQLKKVTRGWKKIKKVIKIG